MQIPFEVFSTRNIWSGSYSAFHYIVRVVYCGIIYFLHCRKTCANWIQKRGQTIQSADSETRQNLGGRKRCAILHSFKLAGLTKNYSCFQLESQLTYISHIHISCIFFFFFFSSLLWLWLFISCLLQLVEGDQTQHRCRRQQLAGWRRRTNLIWTTFSELKRSNV